MTSVPQQEHTSVSARRDRLASLALGGLSTGLGALDALAPNTALSLLGFREVPGGEVTVRLIGTRELLTGVGLLSAGPPRPWLWARVVGDAIDIGLLGAALRRGHARDVRRAVAALAALGVVTAADAAAAVTTTLSARRRARPAAAPSRLDGADGHITAAVTVAGRPEDVYHRWRDLEGLPRLMEHVESVGTVDGGTTEWTVHGPFGLHARWEAEVVEDRPGEVIAWRPRGRSGTRTNGSVRFRDAPGGRGTEVHVEMNVVLPAGRAGRLVARAVGASPRRLVHDELRRFKQVVETGEVVLSDASPDGADVTRLVVQRPAQPQPNGRVGSRAQEVRS
jgi:uncharacterized membrane protein